MKYSRNAPSARPRTYRALTLQHAISLKPAEITLVLLEPHQGGQLVLHVIPA